MGTRDLTAGTSRSSTTSGRIPSCCHWWWSCCCCHCSGSFYVDNVVQSESGDSPVATPGATPAGPEPGGEAEDAANPELYSPQLDTEALLSGSPDSYYRYQGDTGSFSDMSGSYHAPAAGDMDAGSHSGSYEARQQPHYLGSYHRIRHLSGLSEGHHEAGLHVSGPGYYRSDSYSGQGCYGEQQLYRDTSATLAPGGRMGSLDTRDYRYTRDRDDAQLRGSAYEMQATMPRTDVKQQVGSILKRQLQEGEGEAGGEVEEDEEESAYNEHFKNNGDKPPPGEFRVPSVRVRPSGPGPAPPAHQDYTGTATEQGKHDGCKSPYLDREVRGSVTGPGDMGVAEQGAGLPRPLAGPAPLLQDPPLDRWNLLYLTLVLHGVGTLMPWNIFINAKTVSYQSQARGEWSFLLPDYFVNYKLGVTYTHVESSFVPFFLQYLALGAQLPNVIFNWVNVFFKLSDNLAPRIVWTMLVEILVLIVTIVLAMVDTAAWPQPFFYLTLVCVVILNIANGIYHNTVYGLAARLPVKYTGAVVLGSNLSGTIVALINIVCIFVSPNPRTAAIYYFITALFMLLACFDTYFALPLNRFYRYHEQLYLQSVKENKKSVIFVISYWDIFRKCFPQLLNIFLVFTVTLTLFPAVLSDIDRVYSSFFISKDYFVSITCFLTFNLCAVIGNMLPSYISWPGPDKLWVLVAVRALFLPFFLLCNYRPHGVERLWPVLFHWDSVYWAAAALFATTGGYTASLALMYCPRSVDREHSGVAGMMGAAALGSGVLAGLTLSCAMPGLVSAPALDWELPTFWPAFHPQ